MHVPHGQVGGNVPGGVVLVRVRGGAELFLAELREGAERTKRDMRVR